MFLPCERRGDSSVRALQSLNLPAALDALDKPIGLPPSLLGKAEEVKLEDGMHRIPALIEDVQKLAKRDSVALDEVRFCFYFSRFTAQ